MNAILWSEQLSLRALEWARHCSNRDQTPPFKDPFWGSLGESRWISSSANLEPERAVDLWWSERQNYDIITDRCKPGRQCNRYKQVSVFLSVQFPRFKQCRYSLCYLKLIDRVLFYTHNPRR